MRFLLIFAFMCLTTPVIAQDRLWAENIRIIDPQLRGGAGKVVHIDALNTDLHLEDDIVHIKVLPSNVPLADYDITVLTVFVASESGKDYSFNFRVTFNLTNGVSSIPCQINSSGHFRFLNSDSLVQRLEIGTYEAMKVTIQQNNHISARGSAVNIPARISWESIDPTYDDSPRLFKALRNRGSRRSDTTRK